MKFWTRKVSRSYIYDIDKKMFLLARSSLPPYNLHTPGGGIGRKETPEEALRRELQEELNILPENIVHVSFIRNRESTAMYIPHYEHIFAVLVKNVDIKLSWEIGEVQWLTPEDISQRYRKSDIDKVLEIAQNI